MSIDVCRRHLCLKLNVLSRNLCVVSWRHASGTLPTRTWFSPMLKIFVTKRTSLSVPWKSDTSAACFSIHIHTFSRHYLSPDYKNGDTNYSFRKWHVGYWRRGMVPVNTVMHVDMTRSFVRVWVQCYISIRTTGKSGDPNNRRFACTRILVNGHLTRIHAIATAVSRSCIGGCSHFCSGLRRKEWAWRALNDSPLVSLSSRKKI